MTENQGVWLEEALVGRYMTGREKCFFESNIQLSAAVGNIVQLGMDSWLRPSGNIIYVPTNMVVDDTALAWTAQSLGILSVPYSHEYYQQPCVTLVETAHVLKLGGGLVISRFNLGSLQGTSKWFDGNLLPEEKNRFTLPVSRKKVLPLGFETKYGKSMVYIPPVKVENGSKF